MDFSPYLKRIPTLAELASAAWRPFVSMPFSKFQESGADYVMIDNQDRCFDELFDEPSLIQTMCERRFGIGADGVVVLSKRQDVDFEVIRYDPDGQSGSLGADGARCALAFAAHVGLYDTDREATYADPDDARRGTRPDPDSDTYRIQLGDVTDIRVYDAKSYYVDGGASSPQHVTFVDVVPTSTSDVMRTTRAIRNDATYRKHRPANVVMAHVTDIDKLTVRTYDCRLENELFSSGSGAVAASIADEVRRLSGDTGHALAKQPRTSSKAVMTLGGELRVDFTLMTETTNSATKTSVRNISLLGRAKPVYHGVFTWKTKRR